MTDHAFKSAFEPVFIRYTDDILIAAVARDIGIERADLADADNCAQALVRRGYNASIFYDDDMRSRILRPAMKLARDVAVLGAK